MTFIIGCCSKFFGGHQNTIKLHAVYTTGSHVETIPEESEYR